MDSKKTFTNADFFLKQKELALNKAKFERNRICAAETRLKFYFVSNGGSFSSQYIDYSILSFHALQKANQNWDFCYKELQKALINHDKELKKFLKLHKLGIFYHPIFPLQSNFS